MKRTFLLDVDLDGSTDLSAMAEDILAATVNAGINALACRVWRSNADVKTPAGATVATTSQPLTPLNPVRPPNAPPNIT